MSAVTFRGHCRFTLKEGNANRLAIGLEPNGDVLPGPQSDCYLLELKAGTDVKAAEELIRVLNARVEALALIRFSDDAS
jgi:hypothetical protein